MIQNLWQYRQLIWQLIRRDTSQRYRASYLGALWIILTPVLMLLTYTFVFSIILKTRWHSAVETPPGEFALIVFAGLAAFNVLAEVLNRAPTLVLAVPNYVKKVVFPLEILPIAALGSALFNSWIVIGVVVVGNLLINKSISTTLLLLPLAYVPLILLCLGLGWFLASLGVYIRDVGQGIGLVVQMLFFLSGVFYPVSAVPAPFQTLMWLNPMTTILTMFRQSLLWGEAPNWGGWALWVALSGGVMWLGYVWFIKTKKGFADVL